MPKFVTPRAVVFGEVDEDPHYASAIDPFPVVDTNSAESLTALTNIEGLMGVPATSLPHFEPDKTLDLSRAVVGFNSTSDQDIVALASGQTIRLHRLFLSFAGSTTFSIYTGGSGGTLLLALDIPAAGILDLEFDPRPWAITASGAKLTFKTSSAVAVKGFADYLQSA